MYPKSFAKHACPLPSQAPAAQAHAGPGQCGARILQALLRCVLCPAPAAGACLPRFVTPSITRACWSRPVRHDSWPRASFSYCFTTCLIAWQRKENLHPTPNRVLPSSPRCTLSCPCILHPGTACLLVQVSAARQLAPRVLQLPLRGVVLLLQCRQLVLALPLRVGARRCTGLDVANVSGRVSVDRQLCCCCCHDV